MRWRNWRSLLKGSTLSVAAAAAHHATLLFGSFLFAIPILALAITSVAAFGADNTLGTWKLDAAKSKYTPAPMPVKSLTITREAASVMTVALQIWLGFWTEIPSSLSAVNAFFINYLEDMPAVF